MYFKLALRNVRKSIRDYGIYFMTLVFGVCVFYAFNSITEQNAVLELSSQQDEMLDLIGNLIGGVSVFIAVVLGFLIVYASRYLIRRRKKEFGIYLTLGMPTSKVAHIVIYETLFVGLLSLGVGLLAGILVSQGLVYITAGLFHATMEELVFVFSFGALIKAVLAFGLIFLVALLFNTASISRYKLIDLINADKKSEGVKLRSLPLSVVLFLVSLVLIGVAYYLLIDNGMRAFDTQFAWSTGLVCVGTVLLFFSLAGFLLRIVQSNKKLYYRGLNMFTLRQINSKINTAFLSISIVCMALFLAITASCGGFALSSAFNAEVDNATRYDASFVTYFASPSAAPDEAREAAAADDFDMEKAIKEDVPGWDDLIATDGVSTFYRSDVFLGPLVKSTEAEISNSLYMENIDDQMLQLTEISSLNAQRELLGQEPLELGSNEYLFWSDFEELHDLYASYAEQNGSLEVFGQTLSPASPALDTLPTETSAMLMNTGTIVVPDGFVNEFSSADDQYYFTLLNVMYKGEKEETEALFMSALASAYSDSGDEALMSAPGWPYNRASTAVSMYEQTAGVTAMIIYLAIYIGFVLLIACAAILALQQLSESADNVVRYSLLRKIGVSQSMLDKALLMQIGIYFCFPLVIAACHSAVALSVTTEAVSIMGDLEIAGPLGISIGLFALIYGGYFLLTYFGSRTMIRAGAKV